MPSMPDGKSSASAIASSARVELFGSVFFGSLNAMFMETRLLLLCRFAASSRLVAQRRRSRAEQRRHPDIGQDAVIADHDRRRQDVAQMAADAELAVVAI